MQHVRVESAHSAWCARLREQYPHCAPAPAAVGARRLRGARGEADTANSQSSIDNGKRPMVKPGLFLCLLRRTLALALGVLPAPGTPGQEAEFRAFWANAWGKGFKDPAQVSQLVADLRAANCNAVFVQVRKRGDAYYRGSPFEPEAKTVTPTFDPLADIIRKAHDTNSGPRLEVHAWVVAYPVATAVRSPTNTSAGLFIPAKSEPRHPFNLHPDWLTESETGEQFDDLQFSFDPGHPEVQKYLFAVAMDIITRYDIDGFQYDWLRYPGATWGYNRAAVARFNSLLGRGGKPPHDDPAWIQFRREQVSALLRKTYLCALQRKPMLKMSVGTVTWSPAIAADEQWPQSMACKSVLQDWRGWMEEGILDMNVPLVFFRQAVPAAARACTDWSSFAKNHKYNRHVAIGQALSLNKPRELEAQLRLARRPTSQGNTAEGLALYGYPELIEDGIRKAEFLRVLSGPVAPGTGPRPIFAKPVPTPAMPWKARPTKGNLMGYVYGGSQTNALDGASLCLNGRAERKLTADAAGFYGAVDLASGTYSLVAAAPGFQTQTNSCSITPGKVCVRDFTLSRTLDNERQAGH
jgi:uncharacterized lipoprotein YddW (UPF0748 family)